MARFNLPDVTPQTDINASLFNEMIAGIYEALALQNNGGYYVATTIVSFSKTEIWTESKASVSHLPYDYWWIQREISFNSILDGKTFSEPPIVVAEATTSVPLFVDAKVHNITSEKCIVTLGRAATADTTVRLVIIGKINE